MGNLRNATYTIPEEKQTMEADHLNDTSASPVSVKPTTPAPSVESSSTDSVQENDPLVNSVATVASSTVDDSATSLNLTYEYNVNANESHNPIVMLAALKEENIKNNNPVDSSSESQEHQQSQ